MPPDKIDRRQPKRSSSGMTANRLAISPRSAAMGHVAAELGVRPILKPPIWKPSSKTF